MSDKRRYRIEVSRPFRCPVCGGVGTVPADFYTQFGAGTSTARERCHTCWMTGIVWSPPAVDEESA